MSSTDAVWLVSKRCAKMCWALIQVFILRLRSPPSFSLAINVETSLELVVVLKWDNSFPRGQDFYYFTVVNTRLFYCSQHQTILLYSTSDYFTVVNTGLFYCGQHQTILLWSNIRLFYCGQHQTILVWSTSDYFTVVNIRLFYCGQHQAILLWPTPDYFTVVNTRLFYCGQHQTILL